MNTNIVNQITNRPPQPPAQHQSRRTPTGQNAKPPHEYLIAHADAIERLNKSPEEELVRLWVMIIRRQRGATLSDKIGLFHPTRGNWIDVDSSQIHPLNIVQPAVRANTATMSQANVALKIEPSRSEMKGASSVVKGLYSHFDTALWDEPLETTVADLAQMSSAAFLHITETDSDFERKTPNVIDTELSESGMYACPTCGNEGEFENEDSANSDTVPCKNCGNPAEKISMPSETFLPSLGFTNGKSKDAKLGIVSPFEIRMDRRGTKGGRFHNGKYLERRTLETRRFLADELPHYKSGAPSAPCYALRWQHALENNLQSVRDVWHDNSAGDRDEDEFEVRRIYLKPSEYRSYKASEYWALRDDETNEVVFDIQIGETWEQAILRQDPNAEKKNGICFWTIDKKVVKPPFFADFTLEYPAQVMFAPDAYSVWAQPFSIILNINDDVTTLNTITMLHLEKNSIANVVVDTQMFDFEDFEQDFVPTREGTSLQSGNIRNHFAVVDPPRLGNEAVGYMNFQLELSNNLSGVQPAAVGQAQPGQPYAAQLLQVNQSQGLMASYYKSKAQAKVSAFKAWAKAVQRLWGEEQFQFVSSAYGEEWRDTDLEDFYNCNIDRDLLISYVTGSELPKTLMQRELKLNNFFTQITGLLAVPGAVSPQTIQELISRMADNADFDFDFGNYEGEKRLARARYELLKEACEMFSSQGYQIGADETGSSNGSPIARHIIGQARCLPAAKSENHETQKEFWADQCRALSADPLSDEIFHAVCNEMITLHDEAEILLGQDDTRKQIEITAPAREFEAQQAQQAQTQQLGAELEAKQSELANAETETDEENEEGERQDAHKLLDFANDERERENRLQLAEMNQNGQGNE